MSGDKIIRCRSLRQTFHFLALESLDKQLEIAKTIVIGSMRLHAHGGSYEGLGGPESRTFLGTSIRRDAQKGGGPVDSSLVIAEVASP